MIKRLLLLLALLAAALFGSSAPASAAPPSDDVVAASSSEDVTPQVVSCGGNLGQPQWRNVGDFRNTLGVSFVSYIYVYPGSYKYYCPNYIYVHSGKDIYVVCYVGSSWAGSRTFTAYGWNSTPSWMDSMTRCDMVEYNQ